MLVDPGFDCVLCSHFCSSAPLCTVSLRGKGTYMCPCWTGCTSTIPRSTLAGSCCVKTTAPMRQSSSRCELFHIAFPEERDVEGKKKKSHTQWCALLCEENCTQPEYEMSVFPHLCDLPSSVTCTNLSIFYVA